MSDLAIHWAGCSNAPPLILLHGFMGVPEDWSAAAEQIAGARVGFVELAAMSPEELASRLISACGRPAAIAGYSMGGRLAIHLATRNPFAFPTLIAVSATPGIVEEAERAARRGADAELAERLRAMQPDEYERFLVEEWWAQEIFSTPGGRREISRSKIASRMVHSRSELADQLERWGQGALEPSWDLLMIYPGAALFIVGAQDKRYRDIAARAVAISPNVRQTIVPGAGHDLLADNPRAVGQSVADFFADHSP